MSEPECPDHPDATMRGVIGDFYCVVAGCDWWDIPLNEENDSE